jgi:hypothetical protein
LGQPTPEAASGTCGRWPSPANCAQLAPQIESAHGYAGQRAGALFGGDRQVRHQREAACGKGSFEALGAGGL